MPDIVTFDGANKLIIEIANGAENVLDLVEIYSEWKDWVRAGNAYWPLAFSQVGGDPITDTQNLGSTFFLENGWRIRPAELNHKVTVVGNLYTREPGQSVFVPTVGAFTVNTETRVSSLVDSSVSRLDLTQLLQAVYIDTVSGVPGTSVGIGTPTNPVDNIADAITIATRDKLRTFYLRGSVSLPQAMQGYVFIGQGTDAQADLDLNGQNVNGSQFEHLLVQGAMSGIVEASDCAIEIITDIAGVFKSCEFVSNFSLQAGTHSTFADCFSGIPGNMAPQCIFGANSTVGFRNYSGGLVFSSMAAGAIASVDLDPGKLTLDATCSGGECLVRGVGEFIDNSTGVTVYTDGLIGGGYGGGGGSFTTDDRATLQEARDHALAANVQTQRK